VVSLGGFSLHLLNVSDVEHLFIYLLVIFMSLFRSFACFLIGLFVFLLLSFKIVNSEGLHLHCKIVL
jgi:hypothetical protein